MRDAIIVGGGLSGLSLAVRLASMGSATRRVLLIDNGGHDIRRRAWGFWATDPGWVGDAVTGSWTTMAVHAGGATIVNSLHPLRYWSVQGCAMERIARARFASGGIETMVGQVSEVVDGNESAHVVVDGSRLQARWVFDSRPPPARIVGTSMAFLGRRVVLTRPTFDPHVMTFMDFRAARPGRVSFAYVLPTTEREALVELVDLGPHAAHLAEDFDNYLENVLHVDSWSVTRTESGVLPLEPRCSSPGRHVMPIGRRAGMLKASTGYAFTRIQRQSTAICASLTRHGHPFAVPRPSGLYGWMDAVLLNLARTEPDAIEPAFAQLFSSNDAPSIMRFLDEDATPLDVLRIAASLPPSPFVRAAARLVSASG